MGEGMYGMRTVHPLSRVRMADTVARHEGGGSWRWLRPVVDASMTVLYLLQMAPGKVGNPLHEAAGIALAALFVTHHMLNRGWVLRLGRAGNMRARLVLASDVALTVCVAGLALTGVLMSRSAVPWATVPAVAHVVRPLHGTCAYLGLMLMSLHVGMHMRVLRGYARVRGQVASDRTKTAAALAAALALGAWAFVRLGVAGKLAGAPSFPDGMTPLGVQLALHLALASPFVLLGTIVDGLVRAKGQALRAK